MSVKTVTVTLDTETAQFSVDLNGFNGKGCADVAKMFENLGTVSKAIKKPEFKQIISNLVRK